MNNFQAYSKYYDLLYKDKDYFAEVSYLSEVFTKLGKQDCSLLDIGCGTGKHAGLLAQKGFEVYGVDISDTMLESATRNFGDNVSFSKGDIRSLSLNRTFEIVTSLFHVMSYQTKNEDLEASFKTVYKHLTPNGYFIFDCWYGPGVMNELPAVKVKRMNDDDYEVIRIAEPEINYNESVVDVNFQVLINDLKNGKLTKLQEKHSMRFLFKNEIEFYAKKFNFNVRGFYSWLSFNEPTKDDWYVMFVLQK